MYMEAFFNLLDHYNSKQFDPQSIKSVPLKQFLNNIESSSLFDQLDEWVSGMWKILKNILFFNSTKRCFSVCLLYYY